MLFDGHPHRMEEIHQRVGFCRLNSRIADLRKQGHLIECDKSGGNYTYRLLPTSEAGVDRRASAAAPFGVTPASGADAKDGTRESTSEREAPASQLSFFDSATPLRARAVA